MPDYSKIVSLSDYSVPTPRTFDSWQAKQDAKASAAKQLYVQTTRNYSDAVIGRVLARLFRMWGEDGAIAPTVADYHAGRLWQVKSRSSDFQREFWRALQKHTFCIGKAAA